MRRTESTLSSSHDWGIDVCHAVRWALFRWRAFSMCLVFFKPSLGASAGSESKQPRAEFNPTPDKDDTPTQASPRHGQFTDCPDFGTQCMRAQQFMLWACERM